MVTGHDLIRLGYDPAPWFGVALDYLNSAKRFPDGVVDAQIKTICDPLLPPPAIDPHTNPMPLSVNLKAESHEELGNLEAVLTVMDEIMRVPTVMRGAIMPDACPTGGKNIPVGTVVCADNAIHPAWHSSDMCCSVYATNFGDVDPKVVLDAAHKLTHFGPGGRSRSSGWYKLLDDDKYLRERIESNYFTRDYIEKALMHLGTQGDGNHFLFVGRSELTGDVYMVTHHGSRGFGSSVFKKAMHEADRFRQRIAPGVDKINSWLPADDMLGQLYWEAIQIIRDWTKMNHASIHSRTLDKVRVGHKLSFWNEHNSVFRDDNLYYHAKGATPLVDKFVPDSTEGLRIIPLNMSQPILIVRGGETGNNLGFAPHGAGRNLSRAAHRRNIGDKDPLKVLHSEAPGLDIRFFSGEIDVTELPSAYKNAETVQAQMEEFGLGYVVDRILPYGCVMAGSVTRAWSKTKR